MRHMTAFLGGFFALVSSSVGSGSGPPTLSFEEIVDRTDRVVWGTVAEAVGERVTAPRPQGSPDEELVLGHRDVASGMVFSSYRTSVDACLFDKHEDPCASTDVEIWIPGGVVRETRNGKQELVEMLLHDEPASAPPEIGVEYVLFLRETGHGTYYIVPDRNARLPVDRTTGEPRVTLRFGNRALLSSDAVRRQKGNEDIDAALARTPGTVAERPPESKRSSVFTSQSDKYQESVPLSRVTELVRHVSLRSP